MTKEELIRLVKKTDLLGIIDSQYYDNELWIFDVMEFAKLIAQKEREKCVQDCKKYLEDSNDDIRKTAFKCIFDIQARGQE